MLVEQTEQSNDLTYCIKTNKTKQKTNKKENTNKKHMFLNTENKLVGARVVAVVGNR